MKPKKNPKADLSRRSMLFFQLGMILMLFLAWRAIEYKTYDRSLATDTLEVSDELLEEIPITQQITPPPPPPPPPPAPEVIEVVEDEVEVEETIIESTETNQEEEIVEVEEIVEAVEEEIADVPFAVIENVPVYPGCESEPNNSAKKKCMSEKVQKFVQKKFNTELAGDLGLEGRQRISVQFKIDKSGNIVDVRARAPHPRLEQEAVDVVKALPKMTPGKQRGKAVGVLYALPILFQVE
ncbi:energy transducer TonB [Cochleicola gelatinilyticus]|uniref:Energy transducer TonB n=1 Tax=Cochleicola gelatinilyticus TaxID=1763537 RepID=A0A167JDJ6_9FLAO|nr:energy transducer TonB [Cochleicola gelatinilyticus]OAB80566.1 energy transducer TonB [Cochleicola gelatinilyticus]